MLELEQTHEKLASYLQSPEELDVLHKALKKQNSHLMFFQEPTTEIKSYMEKHRLDPAKTIICADKDQKQQLYQYLNESHLRNYILLNKEVKELNYTHLNFLIYLQRKKLNFQAATFDQDNTFMTPEIEWIFESKKISPQIQKHFSIVYNELIMNALIHGESKIPKISFTTFSDYLICSIQDQKGSFDFDELNKVFNPEKREVNSAEVRTAGIGLNMVFKYASGLSYEVHPGQMTEVTFFINLTKSQRECDFIFCSSTQS